MIWFNDEQARCCNFRVARDPGFSVIDSHKRLFVTYPGSFSGSGDYA
jgi:hypothetical protein